MAFRKEWKYSRCGLFGAAQIVSLPSGTEDFEPRSIYVDRVTYCAGISCRYLAVALVTWGRALRQSIRRSGQYWSSLKKAGQPTAEGFIPVHPVGHTEATSIHLKFKKSIIKVSPKESCEKYYA